MSVIPSEEQFLPLPSNKRHPAIEPRHAKELIYEQDAYRTQVPRGQSIPPTITSPRQPRLPPSFRDFATAAQKRRQRSKGLRYLHGMESRQNTFVLYCSEHDPQGMIQHAVAALQITHKMLWQEPGFRRDNKVAFVIEGVGSFEVSPRSNSEEIEVFLRAQSACMEIHLPPPNLWPSLGLAWLLRPPTSYKTAELADYMTKHPVARLQGPLWQVVGTPVGMPPWHTQALRLKDKVYGTCQH